MRDCGICRLLDLPVVGTRSGSAESDDEPQRPGTGSMRGEPGGGLNPSSKPPGRTTSPSCGGISGAKALSDPRFPWIKPRIQTKTILERLERFGRGGRDRSKTLQAMSAGERTRWSAQTAENRRRPEKYCKKGEEQQNKKKEHHPDVGGKRRRGMGGSKDGLSPGLCQREDASECASRPWRGWAAQFRHTPDLPETIKGLWDRAARPDPTRKKIDGN